MKSCRYWGANSTVSAMQPPSMQCNSTHNSVQKRTKIPPFPPFIKCSKKSMQSTVSFEIEYPNTDGTPTGMRLTDRGVGSDAGYSRQVRHCQSVLFAERSVWAALPRPNHQNPKRWLYRTKSVRSGGSDSKVRVFNPLLV